MSELYKSEREDIIQGLKDQLEHMSGEMAALRRRAELAEQGRTEAEEALAFYKASANAMPNPIFIKDDQLRFVFFNKAYRDFFGVDDADYIGRKVLDLEYLSPEDREKYQSEDSEMLNNQSTIQYETEFNTGENTVIDSLYWSRGFEVDGGGRRGLIGEIVDITKEKKMQRELSRSMQALEILMKKAEDASKTDALTGLFNRSVLAEDVPNLVREAAAAKPVCAMLIDLDRFKQINDTFGHQCGDEILANFGRILRGNFRQSDVAVRYGGDEFIVILPGAGIDKAREGAERLCNIVRAELLLPDGNPATISVGVTQYRQGEDLLAFVSRADEALYLSKKRGRNTVAVKQ